MNTPLRLALYQPDIPQNTGTILRLAACFALQVDIIEPCGFVFDDRKLKRSGMDYLDAVKITKHLSWENFYHFAQENHHRLVLLTTKAKTRLDEFTFQDKDILVFGRESKGVPEDVFQSCAETVRIPMTQGMRSLNVAVTAAFVVGEALRQTNSYPKDIVL